MLPEERMLVMPLSECLLQLDISTSHVTLGMVECPDDIEELKPERMITWQNNYRKYF